jgi:elongator complex protein 3
MKNFELVIEKIFHKKPKTRNEFDAAKQKACGNLKITPPPNRELLKAYQNLLKMKSIERDESLEQLLRKANIRSMSGIAVVTALVKPYNCPGKCVYCPTEVRMPKSYIASEPAAARALRLDFSPYEQMSRRIKMLEANGHPVEKIEYIIKGGTWNAYPLRYQYWFVLESFRAANDLAKKQKNKKTKKHLTENSKLGDLQKELEVEQRFNESTRHRIIGLTLETRPDAISPKTIYHMRQQGCTRIELGLQAPDDKILELVKRGHTVQDFKDAIFLLRCAGFKVDLHFMPDLPGTTPEHDIEMYKLLFSDPSLRPDMVKIYPNTVIPSAELYQWLLNGRYKPYGDEGLFRALLEMKLATPRYCRISRLIRDIPANEITAGNKITNLREDLSAELKRRGQKCVCLRCREIGRQVTTLLPNHLTTLPKLFIDTYKTTGGTEYFLSFEDPSRSAVYAFLRLRIPSMDKGVTNGSSSSTDRELPFATPMLYNLLPKIKDCAFVRELHTYGQQLSIGKKDQKASQHKGLGKKLMQEAERITEKNGFKKIAVISGVGVRGYYRKLGYRKSGTYMVKNLSA